MIKEEIHNYRIIISIVIIVIFITAGIIIRKRSHVDRNNYNYIYKKVVYALKKKLVKEITLPVGIYKNEVNKNMPIYVLGGHQGSLTTRFQKAASLYHQGLSHNILILSRAGITEFSPEMGRNLTNNEWSIRELERLNVKKEDIELVNVRYGLLGTMSEAKDISCIVKKKGFKGMLLVTSDYHTRRVITAFSKYASNNNVKLYMYGSKDTSDLPGLLIEYIKLLFYETISWPGYIASCGRRADEAKDISQ